MAVWSCVPVAEAAAPDAPGCAWEVHRSDGTWLEGGFGQARMGESSAITPDTVFDIASVSKQFTALAIVQLAGQGALDLDDSVRRHVPELPPYFDSIRLRHLVWHTGGVPDYIQPLFNAGRKDAVVTADDVLRILASSSGPHFEPGSRFDYSNSGYFLLAQVVERVSGKTMAEYAQAEIFNPLGLRHTRIVDAYPNPIGTRARGHRVLPEGAAEVEITWELTGDGQVYTTVGDLRRWMQILVQGHPAIQPGVLEMMKQRGQLDDGTPQDYGYGLEHARLDGQDVLLHEGAWSGSVSRYVWSPQGHGGVVLCNYHNADVKTLLDPILRNYATATATGPARTLARTTATDSATTPASTSGAGTAVPMPLSAGHVLRGLMPVGGSYVFDLDVPVGHVVQGEFDGRNAVLDLQDDKGRHLRRLGRADATPQSMMWVASDNPQRLAVRHAGNAAGRFELRLTKVLAPRAQDAADQFQALDSPRLRALHASLASGGNTDAFWIEVARDGSPLIEPLSEKESLVTFLWRGEARNVRLFGSPSGNHDPLKRLGKSDVWWATFRMPNTARLSYRLAPNVPDIQGSPMAQRRVILATAQRDPLNPRVYPDTVDSRVDVYQGASVVALPKAPPQPWIGRNARIGSGTLVHHEFDSTVLGNRRDVWVYRPAGVAPEALLVLFDAHAYLEQVPTPAIIDNLMAEGLIPPTAVVLIGNASPVARGVELPPNEPFARFLDEELMPWVEGQGIAQPAQRTVIAGSSYGGLASAYGGLMSPHRFGNVLSLSGSYWWAPKGGIPGWMMREYVKAPKADVRFYLDAGRYEASRGGRDGILETSRHLGDVLRAKGYTVTQVEHDTGHDYLHWQGSLGCGLIALLNPSRYRQGLPACTATSGP